MPDYRRNRVPGGTYFFTVNLHDRRSDLLVARIDGLRDAVRQAHARHPFHIDAWVVLPDHMHCIWTLPDGDADFSGRWKAIKTAFSKRLPATEDRSPRSMSAEVSAAYGKGGSGSTPFGTTGTMRPIWTTSISTQ